MKSKTVFEQCAPGSQVVRSPAVVRCGRRDASDERGVTIVEFTISLVVVLFFILSVVDIGIALYHYSVLNHVTSKATRQISVLFTTKGSCSVADAYLRNVAADEMRVTSAFAQEAKWDYRVVTNGALPMLEIHASMPFKCFFLCQFLPHNWTANLTRSATIESYNSMLTCQGGPIP